MRIKPLHILSGSPAVLGRRGMVAPDTHRRAPTRCQGQERFEAHSTLPVGTEVLHVSEPLATMEAEVTQPDPARRSPTAAVFPAMDMETMQMLIAPGTQDLQKRMEVCQGGSAVHQHPTPDEWTDATQDDTQWVDAERCSSNSHALRVAQRLVPLKGVPRY